MDYVAIKAELDADPETIGYTGDDAGDLALLTAENRTVDKEIMSGSEIFEAITQSDWSGRSAAQQADIKFVLSLGDSIQIAAGTKARAILQNALSGATASLTALGNISTKTVSRAEELGFGHLHLGNIQNARVA